MTLPAGVEYRPAQSSASARYNTFSVFSFSGFLFLDISVSRFSLTNTQCFLFSRLSKKASGFFSSAAPSLPHRAQMDRGVRRLHHNRSMPSISQPVFSLGISNGQAPEPDSTATAFRATRRPRGLFHASKSISNLRGAKLQSASTNAAAASTPALVRSMAPSPIPGSEGPEITSLNCHTPLGLLPRPGTTLGVRDPRHDMPRAATPDRHRPMGFHPHHAPMAATISARGLQLGTPRTPPQPRQRTPIPPVPPIPQEFLDTIAPTGAANSAATLGADADLGMPHPPAHPANTPMSRWSPDTMHRFDTKLPARFLRRVKSFGRVKATSQM